MLEPRGQLLRGIAQLLEAAKETGLRARTAEVYLAVTYAGISSGQAKASLSALVRSPGLVVRHALPARRRARRQLEALATNLPAQALGGFVPTIERGSGAWTESAHVRHEHRRPRRCRVRRRLHSRNAAGCVGSHDPARQGVRPSNSRFQRSLTPIWQPWTSAGPSKSCCAPDRATRGLSERVRRPARPTRGGRTGQLLPGTGQTPGRPARTPLDLVNGVSH
jgi:hypothetical protein